MNHSLMLKIFSLLLLFPVTHAQVPFEKQMIQRLQKFSRGQLSDTVIKDLQTLAAENTPFTLPESTHRPPLFKAYPALQKSVPYLSLGIYPTPIKQCATLEKQLGVTLFIKEDGKAGLMKEGKQLFSGNKLRKLEFLLAEAQAYGCDCVLTRGGTGSNHALATTIHATMLGMNSVCILGHQPNARSVQRNLLLQQYYGAKLRIPGTRALHYLALADEFLAHKEKTGRFPYFIPTGGSCDRGALGFVNAAFELKEQIQQGLMDEPTVIFATVGVGSGGTTAGLLLGLRAAGLKSCLIGVGVEPEDEPGEIEEQTRRLFEETNALLIENDPTFPRFDFPEEQFLALRGFGGTEYGLYTEEGMLAKELMSESENIMLDGTYTAKTCAGMLDYISKNDLTGKTVLFWNTYCGDDFSALTETVDYRNLPVAVHRYFEEDVQPLDT